jgi:hypothetical protein
VVPPRAQGTQVMADRVHVPQRDAGRGPQ